jgi:hypothetical protein
MKQIIHEFIFTILAKIDRIFKGDLDISDRPQTVMVECYHTLYMYHYHKISDKYIDTCCYNVNSPSNVQHFANIENHKWMTSSKTLDISDVQHIIDQLDKMYKYKEM